MWKPGVALAAGLLFTGCYSSPPAFYKTACEQETAVRRYETPAPAGLAAPGVGIWVPLKLLVYTGAAWVEHNHPGGSGPVYTEGHARYRVWLAKLAEPQCRQSLRDEGIDPDTLKPVPRNPNAPIYGAENACLEAKKLGDYVPDPEAGRFASLEQWFEGWTAPYLLIVTGEQDPRSTADDPVWRNKVQVVSRETRMPIFENPSFQYWPKTNWFPAMSYCGGTPVGFVGLAEPELKGIFAPAGEGAETP